jgi:hypothetical protein
MREMHEEIIAAIPQTQDDTVLEVAMTYDAANHAWIELRYLTRADGIGWYRQKSLSLDAAAADALLTSLSQVRRRLKTHDHAQEDRKIIPFPGARTRSETSRQTIAQGLRSEGMKKECCERFKRKGKACNKCPTMAKLSKKECKKVLKIGQKR